jgi:hypothetical protein
MKSLTIILLCTCLSKAVFSQNCEFKTIITCNRVIYNVAIVKDTAAGKYKIHLCDRNSPALCYDSAIVEYKNIILFKGSTKSILYKFDSTSSSDPGIQDQLDVLYQNTDEFFTAAKCDNDEEATPPETDTNSSSPQDQQSDTPETKPDTVTFSNSYSYDGSLYNIEIKKYQNKLSITVCNQTTEGVDSACNTKILNGNLNSKTFDLAMKDLTKGALGLDALPDAAKYDPPLSDQLAEYNKKLGAAETEKKNKEEKDKEKEIDSKNEELIKKHRHEVDSVTQLLVDFDRIGGQMWLKDSVPIYAVYGSKEQENGSKRKAKEAKEAKKDKQEEQSEDPIFKDTSKVQKANEIDYRKFIGYMKIENATIQIDNNKIFDISFDAKVYTTKGHFIRQLNTISNFYYSLSFKGVNNRECIKIIQPLRYPNDSLINGFGFNYGDVINYSPKNGDFTPLVKNNNYQLYKDSSTKIYRRRYSDYLSFRTFLDPLGFLGSNPNGFAQLEGDGIIPVNLRNIKAVTWLPELHANFSYIYNNTINSERRQASTLYLANDSFSIYNPSTQLFEKRGDSSSYMNNLDIIRKAYYQLYIRGSLISFELKKQNSWVNIEFGFRVFGAKVASKNDTSTYHRIVPELNIKWALRPDNIFGADLNAGIAFLGNLHRANNSPTSINNPSFLWASSWAVTHELNIYVKTGSESKGGLFFRYNGWFSLNKKLAENIDERLLPSTAEIRKTSYFPQILFGYSTNLSTMIKRAGQDR